MASTVSVTSDATGGHSRTTAAKKFITTKYGTKIDVSGLSPAQVEKVRSTAEDKGAYGAKGAALADSFRSQVKPNGTSTGKPGTKYPDLGVGKGGAIDPQDATKAIVDAAKGDADATFNMDTPGSYTDATGNVRTIEKDPVTGAVKVVETGGAGLTGAEKNFENSGNTLNLDMSKAQDAAYNYITKDYASKKQQEMEAAKQDLANRGIPLGGDLYNRTIADIDKKYQQLDDQAKNQSIDAGNKFLETGVNAYSTLGNTVTGQKPTFTQYQGGQSNLAANLQNLLSTVSDAELAKYGIDQTTKLKLQEMARRGSGGGGGGGSSGGSGGGGIIFGGDFT